MSSRWVPFFVVLAVLAGLLVPSAHGKQPKVSDLTRVSNFSPFDEDCVEEESGGEGVRNAEAEVALAADPSDPDRLVVAWMQDIYDGIVTRSSADGGRTWADITVVPDLSDCSSSDDALPVWPAVADPWLSIGWDEPDPDDPGDRGTVAYLVSFSTFLVHSRLQVSTSTDGGESWSGPAVIAQGAVTAHDTPTVTADPIRPCHAYVAWTEIATAFDPPVGLWFSSTTDCGKSWSHPSYAFGIENGFAIRPEILVLPDGDLVITATNASSHAEFVAERDLPFEENKYTIVASRLESDGRDWNALVRPGEWSPPVTVAEFSRASDIETSGDPIDTQTHWMVADVAADGTVYIAFPHGLEAGGSDIRVARSTDPEMQSWAVTTVSTGTAISFLPTVAVADDGTVGLTYYDVRNDVPEGPGETEAVTADLFFAHSVNGGKTWNERHLAGPIDLAQTMTRQIPAQNLWIGDYTGLVAFEGGFRAAFTLTAPLAVDGATDIFFAEVRLKGPPARARPS